MAEQLADFTRAAALGFKSGEGQSTGNPLGQFIKMMLAQQMQTNQLQTEYQLKGQLAEKEAQLKQQYPTMMDALIAKQLGIGGVNETMSTEQSNILSPARSVEEAKQRLVKEGKDPNDYLIKEEKVMMGKIPTVGYKVEQRQRKPLPQSQMKAIEDAYAVINNLNTIKDKADRFKTGPTSFRFSQAPFAQAYMGAVGTPEEASYKADITNAQATYASAMTGAQRGFKEIQWLESALPSANLPPDKMKSVTDTALARMRKNLQNLLSVAKKSGYDVSQFEEDDGSNPISQGAEQESLISAYMKKYPNRSREEIIKALQRGR